MFFNYIETSRIFILFREKGCKRENKKENKMRTNKINNIDLFAQATNEGFKKYIKAQSVVAENEP